MADTTPQRFREILAEASPTHDYGSWVLARQARTRAAEGGNQSMSVVDHSPGLLQSPVWRHLLTGLTILLFAGSITAWPAADLATITEQEIERLVESFGTNATERGTIRKRLTGWKELLASQKNRSLGELEKLKLVNDFMHETSFYCDPVMWCMEDYWAKPVEFLVNDGGDCEDFAIAKYFTLRALGVADDKLRIVYAVYRKGGQGAFTGAHMVLAYYQTASADPLILDNINQSVLPGSNRPDLDPIFSFNSGGLWSAKEQKGRVQPTDHYRSWGDHWRQVQANNPLRSISPEQRKAAECQTLIGRSPWCR